MKTLLLILASSISVNLFAQNNLNVYDISQKQLRLMQQYKDHDSIGRSKVFADSLYSPYKQFWNGYLGETDAVTKWLNKNLIKLPEWQIKNRAIDGNQLRKQLIKVANEMEKLTGYKPKGNWYVTYGPAWTDLGGLGDFAMVIDLSHNNNKTNESINQMLPHELSHQIMTNVNAHKDTTAISSIIGEGFAVWMNQKYWKNKYTLAQNLGYTEQELQLCDKNIEKLKEVLLKYNFSGDKNVIDLFRNRSKKLNENLPGAIGYYIGYRIVESYVLKNGANSWKDVFTKSPKEIYQNSGFQ